MVDFWKALALKLNAELIKNLSYGLLLASWSKSLKIQDSDKFCVSRPSNFETKSSKHRPQASQKSDKRHGQNLDAFSMIFSSNLGWFREGFGSLVGSPKMAQSRSKTRLMNRSKKRSLFGKVLAYFLVDFGLHFGGPGKSASDLLDTFFPVKCGFTRFKFSLLVRNLRGAPRPQRGWGLPNRTKACRLLAEASLPASNTKKGGWNFPNRNWAAARRNPTALPDRSRSLATQARTSSYYQEFTCRALGSLLGSLASRAKHLIRRPLAEHLEP